MTFTVGETVVYPNHGVGVIEQVTNKTIGETVASFYCLRILSTDSTVMVPVGNTAAVGLRKVLTKREINKVMEVLRKTADGWIVLGDRGLGRAGVARRHHGPWRRHLGGA